MRCATDFATPISSAISRTDIPAASRAATRSRVAAKEASAGWTAADSKAMALSRVPRA
jgi:hypothetical protein